MADDSISISLYSNKTALSITHLLSRIQNLCPGLVDEVKRLDVLSAEGDPHKLGQRGQTAEKADSDFHLLPGSASVQLSLVHQVLAVTGSEHVEVIPRQGLHGTRTLAWQKMTNWHKLVTDSPSRSHSCCDKTHRIVQYI